MKPNTLADIIPGLYHQKAFVMVYDPEKAKIPIQHYDVTSIIVAGSTGCNSKNVCDATADFITEGNSHVGYMLSNHKLKGIVAHYSVVPFCLNSNSSYYNMQGARMSVENIKYDPAVPIGYILMESSLETTVGKIIQPNPIKNEVELLDYIRVAELMGLQTIALEAGSGASSHVSLELIKFAREHYQGWLVVCGGIKTPDEALRIYHAGADIITVGDTLEKDITLLPEFMQARKDGGENKFSLEQRNVWIRESIKQKKLKEEEKLKVVEP